MAVEEDNNEANALTSSAPATESTEPPGGRKPACCSPLKTFLAALCFAYFAKAFSGNYMKSSITQIERRFDISSSRAGIVDVGFELGNLLLIAFISYFGAKLHRPRIIAAGCFVMSLGSFLTAMPHFFMGPYKYETAQIPTSSLTNLTGAGSPCSANQSIAEPPAPECGKETNLMWVYVMMGNMLRGVGETPISPLGISYIDDFAGPENSPLYLGVLHTVGLFGPMLGFLLGSYAAKLYVDVGFVDTESVTISPQDNRWVGAWWIGFLVVGLLHLLSAIPFCFIPKSGEKKEGQRSPHFLTFTEREMEPQKKATAKGFLLALRMLASNRLFMMLLLLSLLQMNSFIGFITYKPKYMEQQYGQSTSHSNFITGVTTLPAAALGFFLGGLIMKRYKFGLLSAAKLSFGTSLCAFLLSLAVFILGCDNNDVAGITVSYSGRKLESFHSNNFFSSCNADCRCSAIQWDPVCGENKITYMSACLAGCQSSSGSGIGTVFHNCSCIQSANSSVTLGACPPTESCARMFLYYVISQSLATFILALGGPASFILVLWTVSPELKSLAMGIYMLLVRTLAGIPSPIYFGALIDRTCLKWGSKLCGGRGACRLYDARAFRKTFLGLTAGIRASSFIVFLGFIYLIKKRLGGNGPEGGAQQDGGMEKPERPEDGREEEHQTLGVQKESSM